MATLLRCSTEGWTIMTALSLRKEAQAFQLACSSYGAKGWDTTMKPQHSVSSSSYTLQRSLKPLQVYCPLCEDCYCPRSKYHDNIDGAFFGTTFPHLLLMTYPQLQPEAPADPYVPRVFGFKLSSAAPGRSQGGLSSGSRKQIVSPSSGIQEDKYQPRFQTSQAQS